MPKNSAATDQPLTKMTEPAVRLYKQKRRGFEPTPLGKYLTRWNAWFRGGPGGLCLSQLTLTTPADDTEGADAGGQERQGGRDGDSGIRGDRISACEPCRFVVVED